MPTPTALPLPQAEPRPVVANVFVDHDIVFTSQAPFGQWDYPVFQDACEEASVLMAMAWLKIVDFNSQQEATNEIQALADFQQEKYGEYRDRSSFDVVQMVKDYFGYQDVFLQENVELSDIIRHLQAGRVVVVPADGQALGSPYYTPPGPERHMLLVKGYDPASKEFITNDPGTKFGSNYRFDQDVLYQAIRDYETGYHVPITETKKNIVVVGR